MNLEDKIEEAKTLASKDLRREFEETDIATCPDIEKLTFLIQRLAIHVKSPSIRKLVEKKIDVPTPENLSYNSAVEYKYSRWETLKTALETVIDGIYDKSSPIPADKSADSTKVFVVHGRNEKARKGMFEFLRSIGLNPIEWSDALKLTNSRNPFIGEILEKTFEHAQAVVVLLTPDDLAQLKGKYIKPNDPRYEKEPTGQARPNVLFEAGMAFGHHPDRTILVEVGTCRPFTDIAGRYVIRWNNSTMRRQEIANALGDAGCAIKLNGTDWHTAGNIELESD